MLFTTVLFQLISLMLIAAVGALLTKLNIIDEKLTTGMGNIMTKACLPCLLISSMQIEYDKSVLSGMSAAALGFMFVMILSALLVIPFALIRKSDLLELGALVVCSSFPNVVYIGRPLIESLYGTESSIYLSVITLVFTLTVFSFGVLLVSMGNKEKTGGFKGVLRKSFLNPSVIGGIIGILLFFFSIKLHTQILAPMQMMSSMITPLSMLIIGSTLMRAKLKDILSDIRVYAVSFVRLVVTPVVTYLLLSLFIKNPIILGTLVVGSSLPTGANAGVIAQLSDNNPVLAAKCIVMSTILCLVTTPLIVLIFL